MTLYVAAWIGFVLTFPAWLLGWIDDRALLGVNLALSWATAIVDTRNGEHSDADV